MPITTAKVKDWIGVQDTKSDTLIGEIVTATIDFFETETGRTLTSTSGVVHIIDGPGDIVLRLPETVASGTPTIEERDSEDDAWETVDAANWTIESNHTWRTSQAVRTDGEKWPRGRRKIRVTQDVGYADIDALPGELRMGMLDEAAYRFRNRVRVTGNPKTRDKQAVRRPMTVVEAIELYRRADFKLGTTDSALRSVVLT